MAVACLATVGAPFNDGQAQARVRVTTALWPERSGAGEGVGAGRRPAAVQIGDSQKVRAILRRVVVSALRRPRRRACVRDQSYEDGAAP